MIYTIISYLMLREYLLVETSIDPLVRHIVPSTEHHVI